MVITIVLYTQCIPWPSLPPFPVKEHKTLFLQGNCFGGFVLTNWVIFPVPVHPLWGFWIWGVVWMCSPNIIQCRVLPSEVQESWRPSYLQDFCCIPAPAPLVLWPPFPLCPRNTQQNLCLPHVLLQLSTAPSASPELSPQTGDFTLFPSGLTSFHNCAPHAAFSVFGKLPIMLLNLSLYQNVCKPLHSLKPTGG